jgi:hypothetical protein
MQRMLRFVSTCSATRLKTSLCAASSVNATHAAICIYMFSDAIENIALCCTQCECNACCHLYLHVQRCGRKHCKMLQPLVSPVGIRHMLPIRATRAIPPRASGHAYSPLTVPSRLHSTLHTRLGVLQTHTTQQVHRPCHVLGR